MVKSEQQRQKQLSKKKAKERQKHKQIARQKQELTSLAGKMAFASGGRVVHCSVTSSINETGIGNVAICREAPDGTIALASFLVDIHCLGIKNALGALLEPAQARESMQSLRQKELADIAPGVARGLVEGAVEYGRENGFEPHADYRRVAPIFGDIEAKSIEGLFEFGRDGKPFFMSGPYDDRARCQQILRTLEAKRGTGNFDFVLAGGIEDLTYMFGVKPDELELEADDAQLDGEWIEGRS